MYPRALQIWLYDCMRGLFTWHSCRLLRGSPMQCMYSWILCSYHRLEFLHTLSDEYSNPVRWQFRVHRLCARHGYHYGPIEDV